MKRVLHVSCGGLGNGGVQAVIMGITRKLTSKDLKFDIIVFTDEKRHYDDEFEKLGGRIFRVSCGEQKKLFLRKIDFYIRSFRIFFYTYNILKKEGPYEAIHCHNYFEASLCCLAAKLAKVKVRISHSHSDMRSDKTNIIYKIYIKILKNINTFSSNFKIGCSKNACKYLFRTSDSVQIIQNGIDLEYFKIIEKKVGNGVIVLTNVGQFSKIKNQEFLIKILYEINKVKDNIVLNLVGFGEQEKNNLIQLGTKLNIIDNIRFLNHDINIPSILAKTDLFIFPSLMEGYGIALVEAQIMNVKCYASNNVPKETDLGLCTYLDLNLGEKFWAKKILEEIKIENHLKISDKKKKELDLNYIVNLYKKIYFKS